jgi:hypothetical protein
VALGAAVGAAVGAFVGFLFTARGRQLRARVEPHVDAFARRTGLLATVEPLRRAVFGRWESVADLLLGGVLEDQAEGDRPESQVH